jgi:hypothetical protein
MAGIGAPADDPGGRRAGQLQIVNDISYSAGSSHSLKAGLNYRYNRESDLAHASYFYIPRIALFSLAEFAAGAFSGKTPSNYLQTFTQNPVTHLRLYNLGVYVQDQWAAKPYLKLTATVRFDRTGNPSCRELCFARLASPFPESNAAVSTPYNQSIRANLAHAFYGIEPVIPEPRFSMVYSPGWSRGTVIRGGIGLSTDLYPAFFVSTMAANAPNVFTAQIRTGLIDVSGAGSAPAIAAGSANAFVRQFAAGGTLAQLQQAVAPASFAPPAYYSIPATLRTPKVIEWSFEIDRQFLSSSVLNLRYIGNHGRDIFLPNSNVNASADPAIFTNGFAGLPATVPDPRFGTVFQLTNNGSSTYNALAIVFRRSLARGLQGQIGYTWSHALDTLSNGGLLSFSYDSLLGQIDPANARFLNYSNSDYDVRQNLTADFTWELPLKGRIRLFNALFRGWSLSSRLNAHTGTPFSVVDTGIPGLSNFGSTDALANALDPGIRRTCGHSAVDTPCFSAGEFSAPSSQANLGNLPRNSFRGPGYVSIDSSLYKTVSIRDQLRLALGASAYNLLNHPNFADPNADVAGGGVGLITSTAINPSGPYGWLGGPSGRALVLTAKFTF